MKYKMRAFSAKDGIEIIEDFYWFEERGVREININEFGKRIGFGHYEDYIFELSTGLFDKNGKEIYEGDVIIIEGNQRVIIYKESHARFYAECDDLYYDISFMYDIEVIGTIHDKE